MSASTDTHGHDGHDDGAVHVHIASAQFYIGILGALLVLTVITVAASRFDFGSANTIIALLIATMKASLVAAFFMHLRHDKLFNTIAFLAAFLFLTIFVLLTSDDLNKRAQVDVDYGSRRLDTTGEQAPGGLVVTNPSAEPAKEGAPASSGGGEHH
jgi:cytochrome c oxidase subunit IV